MLVRAMDTKDVVPAAAVHRVSFSRQVMSEEWVKSNLGSFPRTLCFVAVEDDQVAGYIFWTQKSGFREEVVLELEQMAVQPQLRSKGIGQQLIEQSLPLVRSQLAARNATLKHIIVSTRADNSAQALYKRTLGARAAAVITNLYSADEVIMVAREPDSALKVKFQNAR